MQSDRGEETPDAQDLVHGGGGGVAGAQDDGHGSSGGAVAIGVVGAVGGDEEVPIIPPAAAGAASAAHQQQDGFIDSTAMGSTTLDEGEWECPACTFVNEDPLLLACAICGSLRVEDQDMPIDPEKQPMKPEVIDGDEGPPSFHDTNNTVAMKIKDDGMKPEHIEQDDGPVMPLGQVSDGSDAIINKNAGMKPEHIEDDGAPMSAGHIVSDGSEDLKPSKKRDDNRVKPRVLVAHEGEGSANQTSGQQPSTATQQVPNSPRDSSSSGTSPQPQAVNGLIPPNDGTGQLQPTPSAQPEQTSTMQRDTDFSVRNFPALEARLVEEEPAIPYVEAVPVETHITQEGNNNGRSTQPWWKEHKRLTIFIVILFVIIAGMGATIGGILSSNNGNDPSAVEEMNAGTADPPNEESAPSPVNSTGPLTEPTQQSGGSDRPSLSNVDIISTNETVIQGLNISIEETSAAPTQPVSKQPTLSPVLPEQPTNTPTQPEIASPTNIFDTKNEPTKKPTKQPTNQPSKLPTRQPTKNPTIRPTTLPTKHPTPLPTQSSNIGPGPHVWKQQGQALVGDAAGDEAGRSVALSDDGLTLAIGATQGDIDEGGRGYVKVYRKEKSWSSWVQLGQDLNTEVDGDILGWSVSLSANGRVLAVGAPGYWGAADRPGYVRVYYMEGNGNGWKRLDLDIMGQTDGDQFGVSVSLSSDGKKLAIGANTNDDKATYAGQVRVYQIDYIGTGASWKQLGQDINGEALGDSFGAAIALSGDGNTLAIGAYFNDGNGNKSGHVRVYEMRNDGNNPSWEQVGQDIDGESSQDVFGESVALSSDGNILAIGAPAADDITTRTGYVKVYQRSGDGSSSSFQQLGQDLVGEAPRDRFGRSVALSKDGKILAVGANDNDDNGNIAGKVHVYYTDSADSNWSQLGQEITGERAGDNAGWSVSLSSNGKTLAIGSDWNDDNGDKAGHVRVFAIDE